MDFLKFFTNMIKEPEQEHAKVQEQEPAKVQTVTENGETAFTTTSDRCLDFFGVINRDSSTKQIVEYFKNAWNENPELCLKILFNFRDIRNGKGERNIPRICMFIIRIHNQDLYKEILPYFVNLGYWKDVLYLANLALKYDPTDNASIEIELITNQLSLDLTSSSPSLCAKWAPSEGSYYDNLAQIIRKKLKLTPKRYRKMLTKLRSEIRIIESQLSQNHLEQINFEHIPSKAHLLYKDALNRDTNSKGDRSEARAKLCERYSIYLKNLENNEAKVNYKGIMPHEIVQKMQYNLNSNDIVLEKQWSEIRKEIQELGIFEKCVSVVDVSGSMSGQPMQVAVALGILISECAQGPFSNKVITFHQNPQFFNLDQCEHLYEKINKVMNMPWGMNTDIEKVFDELLERGRFHNLTAEQMPDRLFIFTDMQFDEVSGNKLKTFDKIAEKFETHGYKMPQIICWNLRSSGPVSFQKNDLGVALLSGFSHEILKSVLLGENFDPMTVMMSIVEKYEIPTNIKNYGKIEEYKYSDINLLTS